MRSSDATCQKTRSGDLLRPAQEYRGKRLIPSTIGYDLAYSTRLVQRYRQDPVTVALSEVGANLLSLIVKTDGR